MSEPTRDEVAKLLPCPFCGGKADLDDRGGVSRQGLGTTISCSNSECEVRPNVTNLRHLAAAAWNARQYVSQPSDAAIAQAWAEGVQAANGYCTDCEAGTVIGADGRGGCGHARVIPFCTTLGNGALGAEAMRGQIVAGIKDNLHVFDAPRYAHSLIEAIDVLPSPSPADLLTAALALPEVRALVEAAQQTWDETCSNHDKPKPVKYMAPYGGLVRLNNALAALKQGGAE